MKRDYLKFGLVLATFLFTLYLHANDTSGCKDVADQFEALVEKIYKPNIGLLKDAEKNTTWMYWDRLEKAFHAAKKEDLDHLFTGPNRLTYQKVEEIFFSIKNGSIKTDPNTERFFEDLYVFLQDHKTLLNGKDDQGYRLLAALQNKDRQTGASALRTDAAMTTDAGIRRAEETLLKQAIAEMNGEKNASSKWYDGIANFFSPHNKRLATILNNNNQLRKQMQTSYTSVEPVEEALAKYGQQLSEKDANTLKGIIASTGDELASVRESIVDIYGKELTTSSPVKEGDLRIRDLNKAVKDFRPLEDKEISLVAEKRLDELDSIIGRTREESRAGPRPLAEYHPAHLEIRNMQHTRETREKAELFGSHLAKTAPESDYSVRASWDITYHHSEEVASGKDADGKTTYTTRRWTTSGSDSGTFTLDATYHELLSGKVEPDVGRIHPPSPAYFDSTIDMATTSGVRITSFSADNILSKSAKAREVERPLIDTVFNHVESIEKIKKDYQSIRKSEVERKKVLDSLEKIKVEVESKVNVTLKKYAALSDKEIKALWPSEIPENFRERNQVLLDRFTHLPTRISHFAEQIRRNVDNLELNFALPDYSKEMSTLDEFAKKNLKTQIVGGSVIAVGAAAGGGYYYYDKSKKESASSPVKNYEKPATYSNNRLDMMEEMAIIHSVKSIKEGYSEPPPIPKVEEVKRKKKSKKTIQVQGGANE